MRIWEAAKKFGLFITCILAIFNSFCQCVVPLNSFPYIEDFEITDGNWIAGGNLSDWTWGAPAKPVISSAGNGLNCWITGGLSTGGYNGAEASWLQSPCFDFSGLQFPYISFLVFWETERKFDGANLQYSTDRGNTWINVGSSSDPVNCLNNNWFNSSAITYLSTVSSVTEGWTGNTQNTSGSCLGGNGSAGWVSAKKTLPFLKGAQLVIFRFTFGAGTVCNNFDGFAIDNIVIGEAPSNNASFTFNCSANNSIGFINNSPFCPAKTDWNFGDPASGINNTSTLENPSHIYNVPGTYQVTLTVSSPDNAPSTVTKPVIITGLSASVVKPLTCFGNNDGAVEVKISGSAGPHTYSWNTIPVQASPVAIDLKAGSYTVIVSPKGGCPATATIQLTEPPPLANIVSVTNPGCQSLTGAINIAESGGSPPYSYTWAPAVSTGSSATGLAPGQYIITVKDSFFCTDIITATITGTTPLLVNIANTIAVSCQGGNNGRATAMVTGGSGSYTYNWNTNPTQQTATAVNLKAGAYTVTVTDNTGCIDTALAIITESSTALVVAKTTSDATCGLSNGNIGLSVSGGAAPYQYQWSPAISNTANSGNVGAGTYSVTVSDSKGCSINLNDMLVASKGIPAKPFLGADTAICGSQPLIILNPGDFKDYLWQDNSTTPVLRVTRSGNYSVSVTNADGCKGTVNIMVDVNPDCGEVYFPRSFSPNGDSRNDFFGVVGNISSISNYRLTIFNRYGEKVFSSNHPMIKWNGSAKGERPGTAAYAWYATYTFKGVAKRSQFGTVILMR